MNVLEFSALNGIGGTDCVPPRPHFHDFFTVDKPVIFNFHGYTEAVKAILFDNPHELNPNRFHVHGYSESGSTTTPFDMHVRNKTSRYHLVIDIFTTLMERDWIARDFGAGIIKKYEEKLTAHRAYIIEHGMDPDEIDAWTWNK